MKVAIMQPYLFPYIGYFQLIQAVDHFVIYDDVNYINRGWINRNYILLQGKPHLFTFGLVGASQHKLINEIELVSERDIYKEKFLKMLTSAYKNAPYFSNVISVLEKIILYPETNLSLYLFNAIKELTYYLDICTNITLSSSIKKDSTLRGEEKIIHICSCLGADYYINPCGGKELYNKQKFLEEQICLAFLETNEIEYQQFSDTFIPFLSIIDVLMFNSLLEIKLLLNEYTLS